MKAVFLSYFFPPLKAPRAIQVERLARYSRLPILVLCGAEGAVAPRPEVRVMAHPDRSPRWWHMTKHLLILPDPQRPWAMAMARRALREGLIGAGDVLVTFGQPMSDHLAGLYLKRRLGMPWIAHFSDPWSDSPYLLPLPLSRMRQRRMERAVIAAADRVLFTSRETADLVMGKYPVAWRDKAGVLPHAYDPQAYGEPSAGQLRKNGEPLLLRYLGNFYRQRNPLTLARALLQLHHSQPEILENVRIELIGRWVGHADWSPAAMGLPGSLFRMSGPVGYQESLRLMAEADALLIIDAPFEHNVFFPSKLVDYLGAGRPIIALTPPGTSADIVASTGGRVISPATVQSVAAGLADAITCLREGLLASASIETVAHYEAPRVAANFDAILTNRSGRTH